jgi:hypothetical protein
MRLKRELVEELLERQLRRRKTPQERLMIRNKSLRKLKRIKENQLMC